MADIEILKKKIADSKNVMRDAFKRFGPEKVGVTWTGGKDSTLNLWILRQVCLEDNIDLPRVMTIDEGDAFPEITAFLIEISEKWNIDLEWCTNFDVLAACGSQLGEKVMVKALNERNRQELERIGSNVEEFLFEAESYQGNHLMKTVVFNQFLERYDLKAMMVALRWDEHPARSDDQYFMEKDGGPLVPAHTRVCPILHFTERDVWDTYFTFHIPYCPLYSIGYRSLGARTTSKRENVLPAWEQDIENTCERGGRRQDKEEAMERLRKLGYM